MTAPTGWALACCPYAGAGPSVFRTWTARPSAFRVVPLSLPGREDRYAEPYAATLDDAAWDLADQVVAATVPGEPVVVFGHSLGAVLAYEAVTRLAADDEVAVAHLVVSGAAPPTVPPAGRIGHLPDDELLAAVRGLTGYDHPALRHPALRDVLVPALRADLQMLEAHVPTPTPPLQLPITAIRGAQDPVVAAVDCARWAELTTGKVETLELPGGHMYLIDSWDDLLSEIARRTGRAW